ncbi:uncharacterized protein LOC130734373 isoform X1 [Lotus japonicus]|uniref:uncharacterized protein LOC130734373 isoform X1 n=1 Tax=Lotus japonicus TaxID=34305 RepID=UPI00258547EB|nr:uncharacterized protein LOC130734373 isoform X1 [Lotus japonicus]
MKVTWKNNNKKQKQRCLPTLSHFTDPPFEHHHQQDQPHSHPEQEEHSDGVRAAPNPDQSLEEARQLAKEFQAQGDNLAVDGKYREALGKWEAALTLAPDIPVLHEQKAQVLLEIGDAWNALKAATRATELEPSWAEAWVTLGRAQLNFGEPDNAIESFDRALALKAVLVDLGLYILISKIEPEHRCIFILGLWVVVASYILATCVYPDYQEARDDRQTALRLVKKRKQLHSSGLSDIQNRYSVGEKDGSS